MNSPSKALIIAAYAAVYLVWGSTYLGIRFAIESIPPFLMSGSRFFIAGWMLFGFARWRGAAGPKFKDWRVSIITGALMLLGGNGGVTYAEQFVSSGLAALVVAAVPIWMVLFAWWGGFTGRPNLAVWAGLLLGVGGIFLLIDPRHISVRSQEGGGMIILLLASASWAYGSLYASRQRSELSPILKAGMQLIGGGSLLMVWGCLQGEAQQLHVSAITTHSWLAFAYLVLMGSLIGYTAYAWLLLVSDPAKVATYAYVNPVVAVFLGWLLAGEVMTVRMITGAAVIVAAVAIIITCQARKRA